MYQDVLLTEAIGATQPQVHHTAQFWVRERLAPHCGQHLSLVALRQPRDLPPSSTTASDLHTAAENSRCIVLAAGPAADLLYRGRIDERGASGDLDDIARLTGTRSLEPYLERATELLSGYRSEIAWVAERLRAALTDREWRRMIRLPNGRLVALFIDEPMLHECP